MDVMNVYGFLGVCGRLLTPTSMGVYGCLPVFMSVNGYLWVFMSFYRCLWVCMGVMGIYACL